MKKRGRGSEKLLGVGPDICIQNMLAFLRRSLSSESASCRIGWTHKLEEGHLSRTVQDHCLELNLSIDEKFDHALMMI
jgi:hypothetical protein